jgi:hypothetical protein
MARRYSLTVLLALTLVASVVTTHAQSDDNRYNIMRPEPGTKTTKPEPWLAPRYKSPRGTPEHVVIPRSAPVPQPQTSVPPPIVVPQTGRVVLNLPMPGSGPGGRETYQDRAVRCAHQAGVYGQAAGDRNAYIGSCINQ